MTEEVRVRVIKSLSSYLKDLNFSLILSYPKSNPAQYWSRWLSGIPKGFSLGDEDKKTAFIFQKTSEDFSYIQSIFFTRSVFGMQKKEDIRRDVMDVNLKIYNKNFSALVRKIDSRAIVYRDDYFGLTEEKKDFTIMDIPFSSYLSLENKNAIENGFSWNRTAFTRVKIKRDGDVAENEIDIVARKIFEMYFISTMESIIPRTNSLEKIDAIVNDLPDILKEGSEIPTVSAFYPRLHQFFVAIILANYLERKDRRELTERYLHEMDISHYELGDNYGYVAIIKKAVQYFYGRDIQAKCFGTT